ncbi:MAG: dynamin family protein [Myxococcales bacterium]|nr:dynamin family protein [Myxococcales bacterium]
MSTQVLDDFVARRRRGADLLDELAEAVDRLGLEGPPAEGSTSESRTSPASYLRSTASRVREGRFVVLLLGCFSSGKSTLLNALLGRPVLPVKVNPCTAILTEVVYAEEPSVVMHPREGEPETLTVEEFVEQFQLRTASEDEAGAEASDRFGDVDRAVMGFPLPLLRNGVVLLDTPGLDDDPTRTARTLSSLPDADAVIVVLSANRFLTDLERRTLRRELLPLGLRNLFFVVTMVDLLESLSDDPEAALADLTGRARDVLGPLTVLEGRDAFDERFFPLDARSGLQAQQTDPVDDARMDSSGLRPFEDALERFLVEERGRAQLAHLHTTAVRINAELERQAEVDRATASQSVDDLRRRQEELEPQFGELQVIARRVARTVDGFIDRQRTLVWQDLRDFMARTEAALPDAVAEFDLKGLAGLDLLTERGRARVEAQLRTQLEAWLEERVGQWQGDLKPKIEEALHSLRKELAADAADFDALADRIVTDFAGPSVQLPGSEDESGEKVDPVERWFSVAMGAVLLSPGAMAAGWSEGYGGAMRGAANRLGVRLALLTLGAILGPIGWAGLVVYVVSDAVLLALTGGSQLKRLRDQVSSQLRGQLVAQVDGAREEIEERVREGLQPVRDGLVAAAEGEASELAALLQRTIVAREQAVRDAASRGEAWEDALQRFDQAISALAEIANLDATREGG